MSSVNDPFVHPQSSRHSCKLKSVDQKRASLNQTSFGRQKHKPCTRSRAPDFDQFCCFQRGARWTGGMGASQKYSLRWNDFNLNVASTFRDLHVRHVSSITTVNLNRWIMFICSGFCRRDFGVLGREHVGRAQGDSLLSLVLLPRHLEDRPVQAPHHHPQGHVQGWGQCNAGVCLHRRGGQFFLHTKTKN